MPRRERRLLAPVPFARTPIEILGRPHRHRKDLKTKLGGGSLGGLQGRTVRGRRRSQQHPDPGHARQGLFHYLESLGHDLRLNQCQPRDVAARPRKAGHVAEALRVGVSSEDNGDDVGCPSGGLHLRRRSREDDVDFQADEVGCRFGQPIGRFSRAKCNGNVLPLDIAEVPQAHPQCFCPVRHRGGGTVNQIPDLANLRRLLRVRLGCGQRDEYQKSEER